MKRTDEKRNWEIVYSGYKGPGKKAAELVYKEMGGIVLRDKGIYTIHTLKCVTPEKASNSTNQVIIGKYDENSLIRKYIERDEIPENGYVVKVFGDTENEKRKLCIIAANESINVFYGAVEFVDDYFSYAAPKRAALKFYDEIFDNLLPDYYRAFSPKIKNRSVFTWGHPINDYRDYIDNIARLKINQIIIWNDYIPLNAADIIEYAHEYEMKVIWGFAWGWSRNCAATDINALDKLSDEVFEKYKYEYAPMNVDGIYFQSFTEMGEESMPGVDIAKTVADFVNKTAEKLFSQYPDINIQFGLHATSVKSSLEKIAAVDERISIIWEDCGAFPYSYSPDTPDTGEYEATLDFTKKIMSLRNGINSGVLYKGLMVLDWEGDHFVHQSGPFILGVSSENTKDHDKAMLRSIWRSFQTGWTQNGEYAYKMTKTIIENARKNVAVGIAGQLAGGIWFAEALLAEMIWDPDSGYKEIYERVSARRCVDFV